jgi:hypothetical protein
MPANQFNVLMNIFNKLRSIRHGTVKVEDNDKIQTANMGILFLLVNYPLKRKMTILAISALLITIQHLWHPAWD